MDVLAGRAWDEALGIAFAKALVFAVDCFVPVADVADPVGGDRVTFAVCVDTGDSKVVLRRGQHRRCSAARPRNFSRRCVSRRSPEVARADSRTAAMLPSAKNNF